MQGTVALYDGWKSGREQPYSVIAIVKTFELR
jgi:hypothetical protein